MSTLTAGNVTVSCSLSADTSGNLVFQSGGNVTAMTIDSSQNVGIGTSSPSSFDSTGRQLVVGNGSAAQGMTIYTSSSTGGSIFFAKGTTSSDPYRGFIQYGQSGLSSASDAMLFGTAATERARIDSSGNLLVGTTAASATHRIQKNISGDQALYLINPNTTDPFGLYIPYSIAPNSTGSWFISCQDSSANRMRVQSNGGIANFSGNNINLSDRREKTNFAPAKSYLNTICAIPVQTFNYIDQNHEEDPGLTLGVVAQDVQEVAPELVMESNWGTKEEPKMRLSIYQTDLQYALMKCIQEQQQMIEELKAKVAALEAA
jgi:hypothetical protein